MKIYLGGSTVTNWRYEFVHFLIHEKIDFINPDFDIISSSQIINCDLIIMYLSDLTKEIEHIYKIAEIATISPSRLLVVLNTIKREDGNYEENYSAMAYIKADLESKKVQICEGILETHGIIRRMKYEERLKHI